MNFCLILIVTLSVDQILTQEIVILPPSNDKIIKHSKGITVPDTVTSLTLRCEASCPVQWTLEKFRYPTFPDILGDSIDFRNIRNTENVTHPFIAEVIFNGKVKLLTGNYICQCSTALEIQRSIYIYWEGSSKSHLLQDEPVTMEVFRHKNSPWVTLFCGTSHPSRKLYLFKQNNYTYELMKELKSTEFIKQDIDGFHLNIENIQNPFGRYACSTEKFINLKTNTNFARYEVFDQFEVDKPLLKLKHIDSLDIESENTIFVESVDNTLVCCSKGPPANPPAQIGFWCVNPQKCNYLKYRFSQGHNAQDGNETCSSYTMGRRFTPGGAATFRCTTDPFRVEGEMFFSLDADVYMSRDDAESEGLIRINLNSTLETYVGALLKFTCRKSFYLFSEGIVWEAEFQNGSKLHIRERRSDMMNTTFKLKSKNDNELEIILYGKNIVAISCSAHVWNTYDDWYSSKADLNLLDSLSPTFNASGEIHEVYVSPSDGAVTLSCTVTGIPMPKIEWRRGTKVIKPLMEEINFNTLTSKIRIMFAEDSSTYIGSYDCIASNSVGENVQTMQLLQKGLDLFLIIGLSIGFGLIFLLIVIALIYKIRKQSEALRHLTQAEIEEFEKGNPEALANWKDDINACSHLLPYNTDYEVQPSDLGVDTSSLLGQGAFGLVMKGTVTRENGKIPVAVKCLRPNENVENFKVLLSELKIMAFIGRHKNIVSLVGALSRNIRNRELKIAIEFCENGNLLDYLKRRRHFFRNTYKSGIDADFGYQNAPHLNSLTDGSYANSGIVVSEAGITTTNLLIWSIHIASGMEFLGSKKVIHGDLAARNVLLTGDLVAKIGDFGLSKHLFEYSTYKKKTAALLPWKWMAIESLRDMEFSVKSDVWSYGVTIWEIFTLGQIPYPGLTWTNEFMDNLANGFRLSKPGNASKEIYEIMLNCMRPEPDTRPSFGELKSLFANQLPPT